MLRSRIERIHEVVRRMMPTWSKRTKADESSAGPPDSDLFISRTLVTTHAVGIGILGVGLSFAVTLLRPVADTQCDATLEGSCGPGMECNAGVCVSAELGQALCEFGKSCEGCVCTGSCASGACVEEVDVEDVCDDPRTMQLIEDLVKKHGECKDKVGATFTGCQAQDVGEFLIEHPQFKSIEETFPDVTLLTFPSGKPASVLPASETRGRGAWPDTKTRDFYASRLRSAIERFKSADHILIFGRASPSTNEVADFTFAQARVAWARSLLVQESATTVVERTKFNAKILEFSLGGRSALKFSEFAKRERSGLRYVPHRAAELRQVLAAAENERQGKLLASQRADYEERINRSVTIIAISCRGAETAAPAPHGAP